MLGAHIGDWRKEEGIPVCSSKTDLLAILSSVTPDTKMLTTLPTRWGACAGSYRHLLVAQHSSLTMATHLLADLLHPVRSNPFSGSPQSLLPLGLPLPRRLVLSRQLEPQHLPSCPHDLQKTLT